MTTFDHNPDANPNWTPLLRRRVYRCDGCGTEATIQTNHTGKVWAEPCHGNCKTILHSHTAREIVIWHKPMPHSYVRDAD